MADAVTYTSSQNNRSSDANRKTIDSIETSIANEVTRATAAETAIRNNMDMLVEVSIDTSLSDTSTNPVQNKIIATEVAKKLEDGTELAEVATTGKYSDLSGLPTVPSLPDVDTALSDTSENPVGNKWVTEALNAKQSEEGLADVATSGSYNDLLDTPQTWNPQVYVDGGILIFWDSTSGGATPNPILKVTATTSANGVLKGITGQISDIYNPWIYGGGTFSNTLKIQGQKPSIPYSAGFNFEYLVSDTSAGRGDIAYRRWDIGGSRPSSPTATFFVGWWKGRDVPYAEEKVDMFPYSHSFALVGDVRDGDLRLVTSHGSEMLIGKTSAAIASVENLNEEATSLNSSIIGKIGTLT